MVVRVTAGPDLRAEALIVGCALALWVLGAVVLYPGLDAPPFERLAGTWVAAAGAAAAVLGLCGLAAASQAARRAR
jgi:hypothetical protein